MYNSIKRPKMIEQKCAICEKNNYSVLYKANFDIKGIDEKIFSARRLPDRIHYRIVKCRFCGLIYSNPILNYGKIEKLYKKSNVDYGEHTDNLRKTYGHYLQLLENYDVSKNNILEIGCGNGFFLEEAKRQGYKKIFGIEPGEESVKTARLDIRKQITIDIFRPNIFKANFFNVICCFQTLDHIPEPNSLIAECYRVLKKDGLVLFYNHDIGALTNKILKDRSPIIDIEHTYLYDQHTMVKIFVKHGFKIRAIGNAFNIHNIRHWTKMAPLPLSLKSMMLKLLNKTRFGKFSVKLSAGNLFLIAQK